MSLIQKIFNTSFKFINKETNTAGEILKKLNGVFGVYKPPGVSSSRVRRILLMHLSRDLNKYKTREPEPYISIEGPTNKNMMVKINRSYADNELVIGPRYQQNDFKLSYANPLGINVSGVMIMGINNGTSKVHRIRHSNLTRFYKIKGLLGQATDNCFIDGKIIEKSTYKHIKRHHIDMVCAAMQSSHQRKMFEACGVHIQSQTAYELAIKGPIRPTETRIPLLYSIKCINYNSPEFTLEISTINENEMFLMSLIHTLGLQLRSTATCTQIQLFQYGIFRVDATLLKREWNLNNVIDNMRIFRKIFSKNPNLIKQDEPILNEYHKN